MSAYLFVHFQEKKTPDGEQARFAVSKDGYHWEALNGGQPVLWSYQGEKGGRDFAIVRNRFNGKFYILGTDLSISYEMNGRYGGSWDAISRMGSKCLIQWESEDLVHWSRQKMLYLGDETFGCFWAPDVIYDPIEENYIVHWSSSRNFDDFSSKAIYASRTRVLNISLGLFCCLNWRGARSLTLPFMKRMACITCS